MAALCMIQGARVVATHASFMNHMTSSSPPGFPFQARSKQPLNPSSLLLPRFVPHSLSLLSLLTIRQNIPHPHPVPAPVNPNFSHKSAILYYGVVFFEACDDENHGYTYIHTYIHLVDCLILERIKKNNIIHGLWNPAFDLLVPLS